MGWCRPFGIGIASAGYDTAMIAIQDFHYSYPNSATATLQGVTWQVDEGEFVLVAGASGSGKSTLLRCLNGLVPHFTGGTLKGTLEVANLDVIRSGPRLLSRHVGFVAQDPESQSVLDEVESEIAYALENAAIPAQEMRVRVEEMLDLLDLTPLRSRKIASLSGGERQKVAIASALSLRPSILVLDEPTSQLDPQSAEDVLRSLVRLNEDLGLTIILAEHRLERIIRYVDRITYLEGGRIVIDAPVQVALQQIPTVPPLVELARTLNWHPLPLTVREGKRFTAELSQLKVDDDETPARQLVVPIPDDRIRLEVDSLHFAYNGRLTLKDVGLKVRAGELVALIGRNGAGKSTLMKCIVGLLPIKSGTIRINGQSMKGREVADICKEVAYLPQNPDDLLYADTVAAEFSETLRNHGIPRSDYESQLASRLGLQQVTDKYPRDLSVGQRQRVAIGAITVTRPTILLLDEPTRGLDSGTKYALATLWRQWLADGAAILLVTHDVELVALIAGKTIVMSQGEIIASGNTHEVLSSSPQFAPQIARLFPGRRWLTVADALEGVGYTEANAFRANTV